MTYGKSLTLWKRVVLTALLKIEIGNDKELTCFGIFVYKNLIDCELTLNVKNGIE